ncbi:hypothetical protein R50073_47060 [Maricurvus nonylphenolicus]|uniref:DUF2834 domain-containing protein n=1 Tax=Maricurvus nonylphenolicus TaxID=1008307 RepID=UPI0036F40738
MKSFYLTLSILGAIIPYLFFLQFFEINGFNLAAFMSASVENHVAAGISADVLFASFVFWVFMFVQRQKGGANPLLFIVLNLTIGLSCALPAYLYAQERLGSRNPS